MLVHASVLVQIGVYCSAGCLMYSKYVYADVLMLGV
jgi:hypothetical protein